MFKIVKNGSDFLLTKNNEVIKGAETKSKIMSFIADTKSKPKEYQNKFHCLSNCTECCHQHILISDKELFKIRRALRNTGSTEIERIKNQDRSSVVCPLLDLDNGTCSVYNSRPDICKVFGHFTGALACSYNLDADLDPVEEYFLNNLYNEPSREAGRLGVDFTWERGLIRNE